MSAAALVEELRGAGIRLSLDGDDLVADVLPGVDLNSYRDHIRENKPALLKEHLQREIVAAATVEPAHFDREHLEELQRQRRALPDPEEEDMAQLVAQLEVGWKWLAAHPDHPQAEAFLARWIALLRQYERAYAACNQGGST